MRIASRLKGKQSVWVKPYTPIALIDHHAPVTLGIGRNLKLARTLQHRIGRSLNEKTTFAACLEHALSRMLEEF